MRSGQMGNRAVRGGLRAGLMKSSFISGHVSLPVFFHVQLLTSSVPYLCSTVSTGLSVYRNKTTISHFASAGGKAAVSLCTFLFMSQGRKRKSISRTCIFQIWAVHWFLCSWVLFPLLQAAVVTLLHYLTAACLYL